MLDHLNLHPSFTLHDAVRNIDGGVFGFDTPLDCDGMLSCDIREDFCPLASRNVCRYDVSSLGPVSLFFNVDTTESYCPRMAADFVMTEGSWLRLTLPTNVKLL